MPQVDCDVVVVGAGPTGLLLAGDLAEAGLSVRVLEKRDQASNLTRAFAVHARTLEQLDMRGLADDLVATGHPVAGLHLFDSVSISLDRLPTRFPFLLVTPQYHVERLLLDRAAAAGAALVRGAEVTGLTQDPDGVSVEHTLDGGRHRVRARFAVGTDGHHSTVRAALGLDFPGRSVVRSLILADVRLTRPPADLVTVVGNRQGFCFVVPFGDGWHRVIARDPRHERGDDVPVTLAEVAEVTRRVLGTDLGPHEPRWLSRFHSDERQVRRYRVGRVLLAGDAAHVHSPAGGMGMNTGLQDAANLGWRLAAVARGADETFLDGYDAERRPVGATVVRTSGGLVRSAMVRNPLARRVRNAGFRAALAIPPVGDRLRERISGLGVRYPAAPGSHDLTGRRVGDVLGRDGVRLHEALRGGRWVLVAPEDVARRHAGPARLATLVPRGGEAVMLVRPDGHVAWAGKVDDGLDDALHAWGLDRDDEREPASSSSRSPRGRSAGSTSIDRPRRRDVPCGT